MEKTASTGKTVAIAVTIPTALQDVLWTVLNEIYHFEWATPRFIASLVLLAAFIASGVMHLLQRKKEKKELANEEPNGVIGGPAEAAVAPLS